MMKENKIRNDIHRVIKESEHGLTLTNINDLLGLKHKPVTLYHLDRLVRDGKIIKNKMVYQFISDEKREFINLPYYGEIGG